MYQIYSEFIFFPFSILIILCWELFQIWSKNNGKIYVKMCNYWINEVTRYYEIKLLVFSIIINL